MDTQVPLSTPLTRHEACLAAQPFCFQMALRLKAVNKRIAKP